MSLKLNKDKTGIIKTLKINGEEKTMKQVFYDISDDVDLSISQVKKKVNNWRYYQNKKDPNYQYRVTVYFDNIGWRSAKLGSSFQNSSSPVIIYDPSDSERDSVSAGRITKVIIYAIS